MNRQYLKTLQQRAQRLLQISSDQDQQQKFVLSKTKSRRVDLNQVLSNADLNNNNLINQFQQFRNTDVQLLKRCISLTNQNSQLKKKIKTIQTQKSQIKAQKQYLAKQLQTFKSQLIKLKQQTSTNQIPLTPIRNLQNQHFSFNQNRVNNNQSHSNSNDQSQSLKQKSISMYKLSTSKDNSISPYVQSLQNKQLQKQNKQLKKQIQQLQQRLKASNMKKQSIQQGLRKQKQRSNKLWKFINTQIPQMKQIIINLTNKVDYRVQKILLRDINQQEQEIRNMKRNYKKAY